ncbi:adhesion G protein-coupled receptor B1-like [Littorina saxatilis]|uniref:adhesion G protein-coupled receptor B1-like n=1 Tax=Littorina saxatilis TaxID=31220 RepID=UPI0038B549FA
MAKVFGVHSLDLSSLKLILRRSPSNESIQKKRRKMSVPSRTFLLRVVLLFFVLSLVSSATDATTVSSATDASTVSSATDATTVSSATGVTTGTTTSYMTTGTTTIDTTIGTTTIDTTIGTTTIDTTIGTTTIDTTIGTTTIDTTGTTSIDTTMVTSIDTTTGTTTADTTTRTTTIDTTGTIGTTTIDTTIGTTTGTTTIDTIGTTTIDTTGTTTIDTTTGSIGTTTGIMERTLTIDTTTGTIGTTTGTIGTTTIDTTTGTIETTTTDTTIGTTTGTIGTTTIDTTTGTTTIDTTTGTIGTTTGSKGTTTGSIGTTTGSIETTTGSIGTTTGSIGTTTGSIGTTTGSIGTTTGSIETTTGSIETTTGSIGTTTGSIETTTGSIGTTTGSIGTTNIDTTTVTGATTTKTTTVSTSTDATTGSVSTESTIGSNTTVLSTRSTTHDASTASISVESTTTDATTYSSVPQACLADGNWAEYPPGQTLQLNCPEDYARGFQNRTCGTDGQWQVPDTSECVRQVLEDLKTAVDQIGKGTTIKTTKDVVEELQNSTSGRLLSGDVIAAIYILDKIANFTVDPGEDELKTFVMSADNVLQAPSDVWQDQTSKALSLVNAVDRMGKASSRTLNSSVSQLPPISSRKIVLQVGRSNGSDIMFPIPNQPQSYYPEWVTAATNSVFLSKEAINRSVVGYSAVIYMNLSNVFSGQLDQTLTGESEQLSINSPILALSLSLDDVTIITPVRLTFDHIVGNLSNASCRFLNVRASSGGIWSSNGCRVKESNSNMTVCECDHLTNFAVLMSPFRPANEVADVLNVFSIVGCSISIFCLILTLVIYFILWRHVRSDRSVLLVHLCVVLVIAYVTFLAGVNRVEHEIVCTVVAAFLHYLWLVVFFLMLCEGIDIFITIVILFPTKSVLAWLLLTAYGVPLIIVGATMGITELEGYGGKDFCWLSLEGGLLWAFVGPALAALMANFVFVVLVIRALLSAKVMIQKDKREQTKSVVKAICVMTPILGLSWIFGVMSVNDDTVVFQILFVVFNSLQGLMIFILHCLMSKQVREGMQKKQRRYHSSTRFGTQKQSSESNTSSNDSDKHANSLSVQPSLAFRKWTGTCDRRLQTTHNS